MAGESRQKCHDTLVLALARGGSIAEAARLSGWSERTVQRRLAEPVFSQEVRETRSNLIGRASGRLADAAEDAVRTLRKLLCAESESVRLSAARSILELGCRFRESDELEARLAELESIAKEKYEHQVPHQVA